MTSSHQLTTKEFNAVRASGKSLYWFVLNFWSVLNADPFIDGPHIKFICNQLQAYKDAIVKREYIEDLIINVPPGSSKSTIVSQMFPVWLWIHAPWAVVITSSYSSGLSVYHATKSRQIVQSDRFVRWFGPIIRGKYGALISFTKDTEKEQVNNFGGSRIVTSTGGTITGKHGHIIIEDDPMNPEEAFSEAYRKKANRYSDQTLHSRKKDKRITPRVLVMQRLHEQDSTGHKLEKGKTVRHICLPAELSDEVKPVEARSLYVDNLLDPERMPVSVLDDFLLELGSYGYAGQFGQTPSPIGGGLIKGDWFPRFNLQDLPPGPVHFYVDPAYTEKKQNDPTAILAYKLFRGKIYVMHSVAVRKEFPDLCAWLPDYVDAIGYSSQSKIRVEPKASGLSIIQQLQSTTSLNVIPAPDPKGDKVSRIAGISAILESGRVLIANVEGGWINEFIGECEAFPNGTHDDRVDTLEGAVRCELVIEEMNQVRKRN